MQKKMLHKLEVDPAFHDLIHPLAKDEYRRLESSIIKEGCRDPIVVWQGVIVDGHNRYTICTRQGIPFHIIDMEFDSREDAIAWICSNQLGRRNINEETRKYLIGKRFEAEKAISARKCSHGWSQFPLEGDAPLTAGTSTDDGNTRNKTALRLGKEYHLSHGTVEKYGTYCRAIDRIQTKAPSVAPRILSGQYKLSHSNVVQLSKMSPADIQDFSRKLSATPHDTYVPFTVARSHLTGYTPIDPSALHPGIKNEPEYDPDSEITGLTLTIPSWTSSIERARGKADMNAISTQAKESLHRVLSVLQETIQTMISAMEGNP